MPDLHDIAESLRGGEGTSRRQPDGAFVEQPLADHHEAFDFIADLERES
jgi:hypothetical protein